MSWKKKKEKSSSDYALVHPYRCRLSSEVVVYTRYITVTVVIDSKSLTNVRRNLWSVTIINYFIENYTRQCTREYVYYALSSMQMITLSTLDAVYLRTVPVNRSWNNKKPRWSKSNQKNNIYTRRYDTLVTTLNSHTNIFNSRVVVSHKTFTKKGRTMGYSSVKITVSGILNFKGTINRFFSLTVLSKASV